MNPSSRVNRCRWSKLAAAALLALAAGCATIAPGDEPAGEPAPSANAAAASTSAPLPDRTPAHNEAIARAQLAEAVALYDRGEYVTAVRRVMASHEIAASSVATRIAARKVVAFSQCLLNRPQPCRESFEAILALDPTFELAPAEAGHPLWGKAYQQVKAAARGSIAGR
ncbi:MAG: TssQ family T6SS-associated lipoprotein [Lautropia sp.]